MKTLLLTIFPIFSPYSILAQFESGQQLVPKIKPFYMETLDLDGNNDIDFITSWRTNN
ncbi:MAG: hypothetical protein AB8H03_24590 [Saprospiraceae bacterium]